MNESSRRPEPIAFSSGIFLKLLDDAVNVETLDSAEPREQARPHFIELMASRWMIDNNDHLAG